MSFVLTCSWHFLKFWQNLYFHNAAIPYLEKGNAREINKPFPGHKMHELLAQTQNSHSIIKPQQKASSINQFYATDLFWYPLKTSENQGFSDVFRGYQKRLVTWNELKEKQNLIKRGIFYLLRSYLVKFVFLSARKRWLLSSVMLQAWCRRVSSLSFIPSSTHYYWLC